MKSKRLKKIRAIKKSDLKKTQKIKLLDNYENSENNTLMCPLCQNYIACAMSSICGHTFCEICIQEYILYFSTCYVCNEYLRDSRFGCCRILDQIIDQHIKTNDSKNLDNYNQRIQQNKIWNQLKNVTTFEVGDQIDVRDPNFVWCEGIIRRIVKINEKKQKYIVVHYDILSSKFDEEIAVPSLRLAKKGFYTDRQNIPTYAKQFRDSILNKQQVIRQMDPNKPDDDKLYMVPSICDDYR